MLKTTVKENASMGIDSTPKCHPIQTVLNTGYLCTGIKDARGQYEIIEHVPSFYKVTATKPCEPGMYPVQIPEVIVQSNGGDVQVEMEISGC